MRAKTRFHCQACGHQAPRWLGRCPDCGAWNTLKEERIPVAAKGRPALFKTSASDATPICDIEVVGESRRITGIGELD
ncbi:MAG TPA: DNA repair protein RadA, partial [Nitrospiraceae bacterium]|nr:DNA repair protein RadA [Nitrospiraceae bacterium]